MAADCSCRVSGRRRQAQTVCVEAQGQAFVCAAGKGKEKTRPSDAASGSKQAHMRTVCRALGAPNSGPLFCFPVRRGVEDKGSGTNISWLKPSVKGTCLPEWPWSMAMNLAGGRTGMRTRRSGRRKGGL